MFNFFANPSYQGSTLERLINVSPAQTIQFSEESSETFAQALRKEYPRPLDHLAQVTNKKITLEDKLQDAANEVLALGSATQALMLIVSASGMARYYGSQIDQLKMTNSGAAFALASALAEYVHACDVPATNCEGGYRQHLSASLILRDSMESFGFLGPWEQRIAAFETEQKKTDPKFAAPKLGTQATTVLRSFVPRSEQPVLSQVLQQLNTVKNTVGWLNLMPGVLDTISLQMVLSMPQLFMTGQWSGSPIALYANGKCTFCGGPAPCQPCESRLIQIASGKGGIGASHVGPAATKAAQLLINAGVNPYR
jgi:hypothetical protein